VVAAALDVEQQHLSIPLAGDHVLDAAGAYLVMDVGLSRHDASFAHVIRDSETFQDSPQELPEWLGIGCMMNVHGRKNEDGPERRLATRSSARSIGAQSQLLERPRVYAARRG